MSKQKLSIRFRPKIKKSLKRSKCVILIDKSTDRCNTDARCIWRDDPEVLRTGAMLLPDARCIWRDDPEVQQVKCFGQMKRFKVNYAIIF